MKKLLLLGVLAALLTFGMVLASCGDGTCDGVCGKDTGDCNKDCASGRGGLTTCAGACN